MQKLFLITAIVGLAFTSCGQNKIETIQARSYYDSINYEFTANKPLQQRLIDRATKAILTVKADKSATIDTKEMQTLLDSAKTRNILRQTSIEKIKELDTDINYKEKVLDYIKLFRSFYDNEFKEFVILLDQKQDDRFTKGAALLMPKLKMIKAKEIEIKNAQESFDIKYFVSSDGNIRTAPDYDLIKLSDFKYTQVELKESEEISLLSFSGEKTCESDLTYYVQFIGIAKSTGDTVRILSACQTYNTNNPQKVGYFHKEISTDIKNSSAEKSFIVFNKHQTSLETRKFKTTIGTLGF